MLRKWKYVSYNHVIMIKLTDKKAWTTSAFTVPKDFSLITMKKGSFKKE